MKFIQKMLPKYNLNPLVPFLSKSDEEIEAYEIEEWKLYQQWADVVLAPSVLALQFPIDDRRFIVVSPSFKDEKEATKRITYFEYGINGILAISHRDFQTNSIDVDYEHSLESFLHTLCHCIKKDGVVTVCCA